MGKYEDGKISVKDNVQKECYQCQYYKERVGDIITVKRKDEADYNLYVEYQLNKDRLKQKYEEILKGVI